MAGRTRGSGGASQTITVGGHAAGISQISGHQNAVTVHAGVTAGAPESVQQALGAIRATLSAQPATKALTEAAVAQAREASPDKAAIGSLLKSALEIARTMTGWTEVAGKLAPSLKTAADWLGGEWHSLSGS